MISRKMNDPNKFIHALHSNKRPSLFIDRIIKWYLEIELQYTLLSLLMRLWIFFAFRVHFDGSNFYFFFVIRHIHCMSKWYWYMIYVTSHLCCACMGYRGMGFLFYITTFNTPHPLVSFVMANVQLFLISFNKYYTSTYICCL